MNNLNLTTSNSLFELNTIELELIDGGGFLGVVGVFGGLGTIIGSL